MGEIYSTIGGFALMVALISGAAYGITKRELLGKIFKVSGIIFVALLVADIAYDKLAKPPSAEKPQPTPTTAEQPREKPKPAKVADLGLTFDEFKARYNANIAEIAPETGWNISGAQLQVKDGKSAFMHTFNQNVVMVGTADNATGKLTTVIVTSTPRSEDDGAAALLAYGLVIMTLSPEIDYLGRGELLSTLKLHNEEQIRSLTQSDGLAQRGNVLYRTTYVAGQGMFHFIATAKK